MQIFNKLSAWQTQRKTINGDVNIGFVPTMGNLHQGHISLFTKSIAENAINVASIFINPTQFNQAEDFKNYPRTLDADLAILEKSGIDYCLLPEAAEIYADNYQFQLTESNLSLQMEGALRHGHFNGVLTVVLKLLNLVKPSRTYFGEKDYQQYLLIHAMSKALFLDTEVIACPTVREPSGLACSSRNNRLTAAQKVAAEKFAAIFHQNKSTDWIIATLQQEGIEVEYVLEDEGRRFAAVVIGGVRLIDNVQANKDGTIL